MKPLSSSLLLFPFGLLVCLLSSCASTIQRYRLEPASGDIATIDGRPVTKAEQNGIEVVASFEQEDLEFVTFDVEVKNRTDHPMDVNPADFHFAALGAAQDTLTVPSQAGLALVGTAADPTYEAGRLVSKRRQEEKRLKRAKVFNTILMVAAIASDVSSSNNSRSYREYTNQRITHSMAYQGIALKRAIDHSTFADRMQRYDYEDYRWRQLALRTNTLAPGESVRGFVYLPKTANANYLSIAYVVPEQTVVPFLFKQQLVQQKKNRRRR